MNTYDPKKAARVWQRVQAAQEAPKQSGDMQELIMNEWMAAATYLRLARQMGPREAAVLQRLGREEQTHGACLRGIYTLLTGPQALTPSPHPQHGNPDATQRR